MKYKNADSVFPAELLKEIQKYVQDGMVYIPKAKESRRKWGESNGFRKVISERNAAIRMKFQSVKNIEILAGEYNLAVETIKKIVYTR